MALLIRKPNFHFVTAGENDKVKSCLVNGFY